MNKKYSYIPLSEINKESSVNTKNNQIPRPKNSIEILNPLLIYKKGRNINNKRNNMQNDSATNDNYYTEKNNLNNSNTFISCISNNNNVNTNITNGNSGIFDLLINLSINNNLIKKSINNKRNEYGSGNIKEEKENDEGDGDGEDGGDGGEDEDLKMKIECDIIEEKIKKAQKDMENVKINIEKLNKKMIEMKNDLNKLNMKKNENKKELETLISNKETLEEMYNMEILFIKKDSSISDDNNNINNCNINILIEDLKNININQFKKQIIELMCQLFSNEIDTNNNTNNSSLYESTANLVIETYNMLIQKIKSEPKISNEIISEFFINISEIISKQNMGKNKFSSSSIISLLHYLIKINFINQKIDNFDIYNKNEYKSQKQEINQQLIELTMSLIFFENQKHEILVLSSKLKEQLQNLKNLKNLKDKDKSMNKNIENNSENKIYSDTTFNEDKENIDMDKKSNKDNKENDEQDSFKSFKSIERKDNKNRNGGNSINSYNLIMNDDYSDREKVKNKIFENYINNGIALNSIKKKKNKKYKIYNFNSISDNRSKDKIINDKSNYSSSFNYNFNTNLFDIKRNKKNISNIENDKKNILILKNSYDLNGSKIFRSNLNPNTSTNKRKLNNGNDELNIFNFTQFNKLMTNFDKKIVSKKSNEKNNYRRYLNKKVISKSKSKLKPNKSHLMNSESFFTNYKKQNYHRLSNFQKYLARSFTNSSHDLNKNYNSMNNIKNTKSNLHNMKSKNNMNNINILKSFHSKIKNSSNNFINYIDNISINKSNINTNYNKSNNSNSNIYLGKYKKNSFNNINCIYTENKSLKFSILNYRQKKLMKLNENNINNNSHNVGNNINSNASNNINNLSNISSGINCNTTKNKMNGFYSMSSELDNQLKIFKQGEMESFCYYKIIDKNLINNSNKFNPLNDCLVNPEYLGYYECYISIDVVSGCIKISPKISIDKMAYLPKSEYISIVNNKDNKGNNEFYMNIKLKEIFNVHVEKYMKNIIKIQNILLKYNSENKNMYNNGNSNNNNIKVNKIFSINKIINKKEISEIKIEQNEKIKAALCNFFSFSFSFGNKSSNLSSMKIDLVFINFEQFNIWLNTLDSIVKNNVKSNKISIISNYNSASIQKFKIKSINNYKTVFSNNSENNQLRTKSRMQSNNIVKTTGLQGKKIISFYK